MADIFISYAREDRSRTEPLAKSLEGLGWSVFWDRTIPTGKTWRQVIGDALKNARSVIVAWSQKSIESDWEEAIKVDRQIRKVRPPYDLFVHPSRKPLEEVDFRTAEEKGQLTLWDNECFGICGV